MASNGDAIASHWSLEFQETLLDVVAVMEATEPAPDRSGNSAAARRGLTLQWTLPEPALRINS